MLLVLLLLFLEYFCICRYFFSDIWCLGEMSGMVVRNLMYVRMLLFESEKVGYCCVMCL